MTGVEVRDRRDLGAFIPSSLDDYPLDPEEFRLYAHIVRRVGSRGCFEALPKMAKHCRIDKRKAQQALQVLVEAKMIEPEVRPGKTTVYGLTPSDEWAPVEKMNSIQRKVYSKGRKRNPGGKPPTYPGGKPPTYPGGKPSGTQTENHPPTQTENHPPTQTENHPLRYSHLRESNEGNPSKCIQGYTHKNAPTSVIEVLPPEEEQVLSDRKGNQDLTSLEHLVTTEETILSDRKNNPDHEDQSSGGACDNKQQRYGGLTVAQLEKLQDQYDNGEITDLPDSEKKALALYLMGSVVATYRKSGKILAASPNDIVEGFKRFFAWSEWKSDDLSQARNTILKYERDIASWGTLMDIVGKWQEYQQNPEKMEVEALKRVANKRGSTSEIDSQIAVQSMTTRLERLRKERTEKEAALRAREAAEEALRVNVSEASASPVQGEASPQSGNKPFEGGKGDPIPESVKAEVEAIAARLQRQKDEQEKRRRA